MNKIYKFLLFITLSFFLFQCSYKITSVHTDSKHKPHLGSFHVKPVKKADSILSGNKIKRMDSIFGHNKSIIPEYQLQILTALSFFPELIDVHIDFIHKKINTTMQCQPTFASIFKKSNRKYKISINNNADFAGILIDHIPFNAQVGLIGHELAHVIDFERGNRRDIILRGLDYLKESTKKQYEFFIDSLTIAHGLGWQLHDWSHFSLNNNISTPDYQDFKSRIYMTPHLILAQIGRESIYSE